MRALLSGWLTLLGLLVGCAAEVHQVPATEVVVRISADPEVLETLVTLRVRTAREGREGAWRASADRSFARADLRWPVDIVIIPSAENEAKARFEVIVESVAADGEVLAQARAIAGFVRRESRVLPVRLARCGDQPLSFVCEAEESCLGPDCQTCSAGVCGPVPQFEPDDLIGLEPASGDEDAGGQDAGMGDEDAGMGNDGLDASLPMEAGSADAQACPAGSRADGSAGCIDIDECAEQLDDCSDEPDACVNLERAGFRCSCPSGYEGDGTGAGGCTDIDECMGVPPVCGALVQCTNLPGSYQCGNCPAGHTVDGMGECRDVDECLTENGGCDATPMAQCMNQTGSPNTCVCPAGYTGNGRGADGCADIDDCLPNPCAHGEACTDLGAQDYRCACGVGYSGKNCQNDVCSPSPCPANYNCTRGASGAVCRPPCATSAGRCSGGQPCETTADCASGLTCDGGDKTCLQTCAGPLTVTSRESLQDVRYCREVQGDLTFATTFTTLAATDLPHLRRVTGTLRDSFGTSLTSLELPALETVGTLVLSVGGALVFPRLAQAGTIEIVFSPTRVEMPVLTQVTDHLHVGGPAANLNRIDLRSLTTVGKNLHLNDLQNLTSLNIGMLNRVNGGFTASALPRLPYSSIRRLHDSVTGLDRVAGTISIELIGCCLVGSPENQYDCPLNGSGCVASP
jgi:hypothetical protein